MHMQHTTQNTAPTWASLTHTSKLGATRGPLVRGFRLGRVGSPAPGIGLNPEGEQSKLSVGTRAGLGTAECLAMHGGHGPNMGPTVPWLEDAGCFISPLSCFDLQVLEFVLRLAKSRLTAKNSESARVAVSHNNKKQIKKPLSLGVSQTPPAAPDQRWW